MSRVPNPTATMTLSTCPSDPIAAAQKLVHKYRRQVTLLIEDAGLADDVLALAAAETAPAKAPKPAEPPVEIEAQLLKQTERAYHVEVLPTKSRYGIRVWVPKSVVVETPPQFSEAHDTGFIKVAAWFANREGLLHV